MISHLAPDATVSALSCRYFSTALALARLYVDIADTAAAVELLKQLDEQLALGAVSLPEGRGDQVGTEESLGLQ